MFIKIFCENNFDTNDSDMNFILLQRRFDASCIIFKLQALSYTILWRSGSYTCFSNRSEAKNMADFGLCWRQIHAIWYLRLQVITTDQAQFWSRLKFHTLLSFYRIMFVFLSFHGRKFCRFFRVFSMFVGRLTICLGICKFYKLFWPVKGKKPRNISAKTIFEGTIGLL